MKTLKDKIDTIYIISTAIMIVSGVSLLLVLIIWDVDIFWIKLLTSILVVSYVVATITKKMGEDESEDNDED